MNFYNEIAAKVKAGKKISSIGIPGYYFFMLFHDRLIKQLFYKGVTYEMNFIPVDDVPDRCIVINDKTCRDFEVFVTMTTNMLEHYSEGLSVGIQLEDEYFQIIFEVLETNE